MSDEQRHLRVVRGGRQVRPVRDDRRARPDVRGLGVIALLVVIAAIGVSGLLIGIGLLAATVASQSTDLVRMLIRTALYHMWP